MRKDDHDKPVRGHVSATVAGGLVAALATCLLLGVILDLARSHIPECSMLNARIPGIGFCRIARP